MDGETTPILLVGAGCVGPGLLFPNRTDRLTDIFAIHKEYSLWIDAACIFLQEEKIVVYDSLELAEESNGEVFSVALLCLLTDQSEHNIEGKDFEN